MQRLFTPALVAAAALLVTSCAAIGPTLIGSGNAQTEQRSVASFTKVSVGEAIKATVVVGPDVSVAVTTDDNVLDHVETTVIAGKLSVSITGSVQPRTPVSVAITVPSLDEAEAESAATLTVTGINVDNFSASAKSAATLTVRGNAATVDVSADSAASADLGNVPAQSATVTVGSAARATVNAQNTVSGSVDSGGVVRIEGNPPTVNVSTASGGAVVRD